MTPVDIEGLRRWRQANPGAPLAESTLQRIAAFPGNYDEFLTDADRQALARMTGQTAPTPIPRDQGRAREIIARALGVNPADFVVNDVWNWMQRSGTSVSDFQNMVDVVGTDAFAGAFSKADPGKELDRLLEVSAGGTADNDYATGNLPPADGGTDAPTGPTGEYSGLFGDVAPEDLPAFFAALGDGVIEQLRGQGETSKADIRLAHGNRIDNIENDLVNRGLLTSTAGNYDVGRADEHLYRSLGAVDEWVARQVSGTMANIGLAEAGARERLSGDELDAAMEGFNAFRGSFNSGYQNLTGTDANLMGGYLGYLLGPNSTPPPPVTNWLGEIGGQVAANNAYEDSQDSGGFGFQTPWGGFNYGDGGFGANVLGWGGSYGNGQATINVPPDYQGQWGGPWGGSSVMTPPIQPYPRFSGWPG